MANPNIIRAEDALSILNIQSTSITQTEIKEAYQKAAMKFHPDHNPAGLEMMQLVNMAYEVLKDFEGEVLEPHQKNYGELLNNALKAAGYLWAPKKTLWYFRPEQYKSKNHGSWSMEHIRTVYGSESAHSEQKQIFVLN